MDYYERIIVKELVKTNKCLVENLKNELKVKDEQTNNGSRSARLNLRDLLEYKIRILTDLIDSNYSDEPLGSIQSKKPAPQG